MKRQKNDERNQKVCDDIRKYKELGFKIQEAFKLVAEKWYLAPSTVRQIWYATGYYRER